MKIQLSPAEIEILLGLLAVAMEEASSSSSTKGMSPTTIEQAVGNAAYDAFESLRNRLSDLAS